MPNPKQELAVIKERMLKAGIPEDECAGILKPLEAELARRVCGLVWQPKDTSVPQMAGRLPAFIRQDDMCVTGTGGTDNILIEGENLYALMGLQYTHTDENGNGLIDIIYIDPPYNTESTDFAYNDKFEKSEWLSMMETRLKLGRNLLNEKGVIFISINDKFHSQLKLLCDDIFGSSNFLADMIWRSTPGSNTGTDIKKVTEYVLCYEKSFGKAATGVRKSINEESYTLEDEYVKRRGRYKTNKLDRRMTGQHYSEALNYPIKMPDGTLLYPGCTDQKQKNWNWRWSAEKVEWGKKHGFIIFNRNEKTKAWSIYFKQYLKVDNTDTVIERYQPYQNLIENVEGVSSSTGTGDLENIVGGKVFDYPKPVNLIKYLLEIHTNPDAVVLDFFAGSGTTGQAVLEGNAEHNWNRKFILCTNNEVRKSARAMLAEQGISEDSPKWEAHGICRSATFPRLKTVITGIRGDGSFYEKKDYAIRDLLFEKKLSFNMLKGSAHAELLEEIESIYRDNADDYDSIRNEISENHVRVYGVNKIKKIIQQTAGNLYYYKIDDSPCDCETEEETLIQITDKFISYVSIKEQAFEIEKHTSFVLLKGRDAGREAAGRGIEIMVITDTDLTLRDIRKAAAAHFKEKNCSKKVYCKAPEREQADDILFVPYPKDAAAILCAKRRDILKGELR